MFSRKVWWLGATTLLAVMLAVWSIWTNQRAASAASEQLSGQNGTSAFHEALLKEKADIDERGHGDAATLTPPPNDSISTPTVINTSVFHDALNTTGATTTPSDPNMGCGTGTNSNTVWYRFDATEIGPALITTFGSNYDTVVAIFSGAPGALTFVTCNDDFSGLQSQVEFSAEAGLTYYIEVADYGSPGGGNLNFDFIFTPLATIDIPLDIVLMQDETGSMGDDIGALKALAPQIWDSIEDITTAEFAMSVVGFRDYARSPYGDSGDWVYRLLGDLTSDRPTFVNAVNVLTASGGSDTPESQYAALNYLLTPSHPCIDSNGDGDCLDPQDTLTNQQPDFRSGTTRVVLLATDADFHDPDFDSGYPGPFGSDVLARVLDSRAIVIGLVPGGAGALPQLDELAAATGGSVQSTGSSGQQVAAAIIAAISNIRPVSSVLSSVEVANTSIPADGLTTTTITITVRDTADRPVPQRYIYVYSSRGALDVIAQPAGLTDAEGVATATIASTAVGTTVIAAVDVFDNITFMDKPTVTFEQELIPPGERLDRMIDFLHEQSVDALDQMSDEMETAGDNGDYFGAAIPIDKAMRAVNVFFNLFGLRSDPDSVAAATTHQISGIRMEERLGWQRLSILFENWPGVGEIISIEWEELIIIHQWVELAHEIPYDGFQFMLSELTGFPRAYFQERGKEFLADQFTTYLSTHNDAFSQMADNFAADASDLQSALEGQKDEISAGIPVMTPEEQMQYADDLFKRAATPFVYRSVVDTESLFLDSLRDSHDGLGGGFAAFVLKFLGHVVAKSAFDGPGVLLYDSATGAMDYYFDTKKIEAAERAYAAAPSVLKRATESAASIWQNEATGFDRITNQLPSKPATGTVGVAQHYSVGSGWGPLFKETASYSEIQLTNTGTENAVFTVYTRYSYFDKIFGLPWAFIPMVEYDTVNLEPGEARTVRIDYKQEEKGGSPEEGSPMWFDVMAANTTGTFYIGSDYSSWEPTRVGEDGSRVLISADAQTIENPIDLYVLGGEGEPEYDAILWIVNPFTQTIQVNITQTLPIGAEILDTDGVIVGNSVVWQGNIAASDLISASISFRYEVSPGTLVTLMPATMAFVEPMSGVPLVTHSNAGEFEGAWPVSVEATVTNTQFGVGLSLPISVTSLVPDATSGSISVVIRDSVHNLWGKTVAFNASGYGQQHLTVNLPGTLRPGAYVIEIWLKIGGNQRQVIEEILQVAGSNVYLPVIHK